VYRYQQHTIDVFVRPDVAHRRRAGPTRTVRGFNVAHASGASMDWLAVSDAERRLVGVCPTALPAKTFRGGRRSSSR
jgi:hypothetical protein